MGDAGSPYAHPGTRYLKPVIKASVSYMHASAHGLILGASDAQVQDRVNSDVFDLV